MRHDDADFVPLTPEVFAGALRARGLPDWDVTLSAQVSTAALGHAIHTWADGADGGIDALITRAFIGLRDFSDIEIAPGPATRR